MVLDRSPRFCLTVTTAANYSTHTNDKYSDKYNNKYNDKYKDKFFDKYSHGQMTIDNNSGLTSKNINQDSNNNQTQKLN